MNDIFSGKVCTFYKSVVDFTPDKKLSTPGKNVPIIDILSKQGYTNSKLLNEIRLSGHHSELYDKKKKQLSAACFSSVQDDLSITRSDNNNLFHTGFISFDIDIDKNPSLLLPNVSAEMKEFIINEIPYVAYLGTSVSNIGLWGLIPIAYKEEHYSHFRSIVKYFNDRGIYMDAPLSDISRVRFIAYDPDAHFELNPRIYTDTIETQDEIFKSHYTRADVTSSSDEFFQAACKWVEMKHGLKFEQGSIHNYLLRLYSMLRYAHVGREAILQWIFKNLIPQEKITTNCLDEIEIK